MGVKRKITRASKQDVTIYEAFETYIDEKKSLNKSPAMFGSIMSPEAKAWNEAHDNIQMEYYDREIARLEPLAQKELEDEITANILKNIEKGIYVDASKIGKEIQKALKGLKL